MENSTQSWCSSFSVFIFVSRARYCRAVREAGLFLPLGKWGCSFLLGEQGNCQGEHSWLAFPPLVQQGGTALEWEPSGHRTAPLSCRWPGDRDVLSTLSSGTSASSAQMPQLTPVSSSPGSFQNYFPINGTDLVSTTHSLISTCCFSKNLLISSFLHLFIHNPYREMQLI